MSPFARQDRPLRPLVLQRLADDDVDRASAAETSSLLAPPAAADPPAPRTGAMRARPIARTRPGAPARAARPSARRAHEPPGSRSPLLRQGLIGTAAMAALILLAVFYSVVAGAVDRAARQRRAAIQLEAAARAAADARFAARPVLARPGRSRGCRSATSPRPSPSVRRSDAVRSRPPRPRPAVIIGAVAPRARGVGMSRERGLAGHVRAVRDGAPLAAARPCLGGALRPLRGRPRPRPPPDAADPAVVDDHRVGGLPDRHQQRRPFARHARRRPGDDAAGRDLGDVDDGERERRRAHRDHRADRAGAVPRPAPLHAGAADRGPAAARLRALRSPAAPGRALEHGRGRSPSARCCRWCAWCRSPMPCPDPACSPSARRWSCSPRSSRPG